MDSKMARVSHVGMDVHKHFSRVTASDASGLVVFRQRLEHRDRQVLRQSFADWPAGTPVVLEGTFGWSWMSDELACCQLEPHLASGRRVDGWRKSRGLAKNNRLDADLLAEVFREPGRWWEVWLPPAEVRQQREWLRYRSGLVETQTVLKNRIQAVLHRHGVLHPYSDLFGRKGRVLLQELMGAEDPRLPASGRATVKGNLALLDKARGLIAEVTRHMRCAITPDTDAEIWRSLPGIAWVLAYTIQAEIGTLSRFKNAGCLSAYSLLVPRDDDSGEEDPSKAPLGRHVGKLGRTTLKWAFLQASHSAVIKSRHMKALFDRITDQGKKNRSRGYMAVAHELCKIGYACVKHRRMFSEVPPPRGGARPCRNSHSEAGGPDPAMVAAASG